MREADIEAVNIAVPDYIGFVFAKSKRRIDERKAMALKACLDSRIKVVGVFADEEIGNIIRLCENNVIDLVQLHGSEDEEYIRRLRYYVSNMIIKAVRVREADDVIRAGDFTCDYLLLDTYHEGAYGGTGRTFDWSVIPKHVGKPFFLAGGINCGNLAQAVRICGPYCIDVSSGAETNGCKDPQKIIDIVAGTRLIDRNKIMLF